MKRYKDRYGCPPETCSIVRNPSYPSGVLPPFQLDNPVHSILPGKLPGKWQMHLKLIRKPGRAKGPQLNSPKAVVQFVQSLTDDFREAVICICTDARNHLVGYYVASVGSRGAANVDPMVIFPVILKSGATSFFLVHNHPAGDPTPSSQDLDVSRKIQLGAMNLNLRYLDFIVVGESGRFYSMADAGLM